MISVDKFLSCVQQNVSRITHYQSGGDGSDGGCDCIGLIIGALRLAGEKWTGTHGSNWAARNALQESQPLKIGGVSDLQPGYIVFKAKQPGDDGYSLPDAYKNSSTQLDYYHVGVVTSVNPMRITHCTKSDGEDGVINDEMGTYLGNWKYYGKLKQVNYSGKEEDNESCKYYAVVTAGNGYPVKMRSQPSTNAKVLYQLPVGTEVEVMQEYDQEWAQIRYAAINGYMMRKFLAKKDAEENKYKKISAIDLMEIRACLADALGLIEKALHGGDNDE